MSPHPTAFTNFAINPIIKWRGGGLKGEGGRLYPTFPTLRLSFTEAPLYDSSHWYKAMHLPTAVNP